MEHLENMEERDGADPDYIKSEIADARRQERGVNEKFEEFKQHIEEGAATIGDGNAAADTNTNSVEGSTAVGQPNRIINARKPPEPEADASLRDYSIWLDKFQDYMTLTKMMGTSQAEQMTTLRSFVSTGMCSNTRSIKIMKIFLRSKRNIAIDSVEFNQRR